MLNRIKDFFTARSAAPADGDAHSDEELRLAAAALMVEAAQMDDSLEAGERDRIVELVKWRFALTEDEGRHLVDRAEKAVKTSVQHHGFVSTIVKAFSHEERVQLVEMLWDIAYTDGELHDMEAALLRRISGLLHVTDQESGAARKRAIAAHGLSD
ncbi:TerB family tellurite resistance protein [Fodinicurvata sp. EGI_FJ10296]|uniref:tellurite resistance TerB family protein n=1 Tax=Fodinicurvata sp. EGI_FJ10296 TaxID=3231908 RepID=UPI003455418B